MTESAAIPVKVPTREQCEKALNECHALAGALNIGRQWLGSLGASARSEIPQYLCGTASALGYALQPIPFQDADELAAQQPSDLVRRLRGLKWAGSGRPFIHPDITEAADRIEALEAAASQPSEREARVVRAAMIVRESYSANGPYTGTITKIVMDILESALAAYDTPAKDERREEAK